MSSIIGTSWIYVWRYFTLIIKNMSFFLKRNIVYFYILKNKMNREGLCVRSMEIFWLWSQNNLLFPHNKNKKRNEVGRGNWRNTAVRAGTNRPAPARLALKSTQTQKQPKKKKGSSRGPSASQPGGKPLVSCRTWLCSHGARGGEAVMLLNRSGERAARGRGVHGVNFNRCF